MPRRTRAATPRSPESAPTAQAGAPDAARGPTPAASPEPLLASRGRMLHIGGIDQRKTTLLSGLRLDVLPDDIDAHTWVPDCLQQAADQRVGIAVVGLGDVGKSVALRRAIHEFEVEQRRLHAADAPYRPLRVVSLTTKATSGLDFLIELYAAAFDTAPTLRVHGRAKRPGELRAELLARCYDEDVAALTLDNAESVDDAVLGELRHFAACATDDAPDRRQVHEGRETMAAGGIGVLLVGTMALVPRLQRTGEVGNLWKRVQPVAPIPSTEVPHVLARLLPAFAAQARAGEQAWAETVRTTLSFGREVGIGTVDYWVRMYVRRAAVDDPGIHGIEDVPWDLDLLRQVRDETWTTTSHPFHGASESADHGEERAA